MLRCDPAFGFPGGRRCGKVEAMSDLIAIVGRPNVGKSALFNRIVGKRIAIVHDEPGVTRDRISAEAEWCGRSFTLVDTGGIGLLRGEQAKDVLVQAAMQQVALAVEAASLIFLVVDGIEGLVPLDTEVAHRLRASGKPVLLVVNKVDTAKAESDADDFAVLGFNPVISVSAIHGLGIEPLMKTAMALLPPAEAPPLIDSTNPDGTTVAAAGSVEPLKLAVVGRPNVGKSSLINALTQSERVIVTPIPGTTRDAVDVPFEVETDGHRQQYILIDTAGVRKERRIHDSIEFFSLKRTEDSIARCDIVVFVLDATEGILEQDKKIADKIVAERKACLVLVNKWDLVAEDLAERRAVTRNSAKSKPRPEGTPRPLTTLAEFAGWVQEKLFFLSYAPVIFTSAKSGLNRDRLLEAVRYVAAQLRQKIPTALLNRTLRATIEHRQPVSATGHRLTFYYATQVKQSPPTFLLFVNRDELFSASYAKYITEEMRRAFGFEGCPLVLVAKPRPKTISPIRKHRSGGVTRKRS
jgi:GTPase